MKVRKPMICLVELICICILSISSVPLYAQRFSAGIVGGLNASQVDGDYLAGFDKLGLTGGLKATMDLESRFDFNVEFLYSQRGSRPDIFTPAYDPDIEINLHYAEIPVYISLGDWFQEEGQYYKVSAQAGLSYGRLISASTFDHYNSAEESLDLLVPYFNDNDLSWMIGISFRMSPHWGITGRYTREIIPLLSPKKHNLPFERLLSYFMTFRFEYYF